jgi:hypothetical protein
VEEQISRVRGEIEAMQAELRGLNRRISFSSIALTVREQYAAQFTGAASSLRNQLRNASVNGLREAWLSLLGICSFPDDLRTRVIAVDGNPVFSGAIFVSQMAASQLDRGYTESCRGNAK